MRILAADPGEEIAPMNSPATGQTAAQALGFDAEAKLLLIHADDLGICHAANQAFFRVFEAGMVKSGSIMMTCPWVNEVAAYSRGHPDADIGVHLTLNSEWQTLRWGPVASSNRVKSLLDPDGCLWRAPMDTLAHADTDEIGIELTAQIEKALAIGLEPTHLDFHMGTVFLKPEWVEIALTLSRKYDTPLTLVRWSEDFGRREVGTRGVPPDYMQSLLQNIEQRGLSCLDHFITVIDGIDLPARRAAYHKVLQELPPGITELIIHPGLDSDEMRTMMSGAYGGHTKRISDCQVFCEPATRRLIEQCGIQLISWQDLVPRIRQR